jgi:hypothetical protein
MAVQLAHQWYAMQILIISEILLEAYHGIISASPCTIAANLDTTA